ncbi:GTP pyrophosphokinase, partial [Streptococcus thermophilus]|nr:GTP pyrophosphokinase [Streptococcus thermophilus]
PMEFQIRTREMHQIAEYGVAAHWAYKQGIKSKVDVHEISETLNWIHELVELREEAGDSAEDFVKAVQEDILSDKIYVFTPNGEVQ